MTRFIAILLMLLGLVFAAAVQDPVEQDRVEEVIPAHDSAVVAVANVANKGEKHGMSIYYPETEEPRVEIYTNYGLEFLADTHWDEFLLSYFSGESLPVNVTDLFCRPEQDGIRLNWRVEHSQTASEYVIRRQDEGDGDYGLRGLVTAATQDGWTCLDTEVCPGRSYRYRVEFTAGTLLFETEWITVPDALTHLVLNRPNPFSQLTTIEFEVAEAGTIELTIHDLIGG